MTISLNDSGDESADDTKSKTHIAFSEIPWDGVARNCALSIAELCHGFAAAVPGEAMDKKAALARSGQEETPKPSPRACSREDENEHEDNREFAIGIL